jgi:hypothetical protein
LERLFTAFVSSTYLDLKSERQRLVQVLLGQQCVPLGMEFFPSTGKSQWPIIQETMNAADFCVFVVAGRYGTMSDEAGLSWTHKEFREAVRRRKPIVGILHRAPGSLQAQNSESNAKARAALTRFRAEIQDHTVCRFYESEADLVEAVTSSIGALKSEGAIEGWVPAGSIPVVVPDSDFDRVYELETSEWTYQRSNHDPRTWDGHYRGRRRLRAKSPEGLPSCVISFTRGTDRQLPFDEGRHPILRLTEAARSGGGEMVLAAPRKRLGASFAQDVVFNPPLAFDETADFTVEEHVSSYKYAFREDLIAATIDSRSGVRSYDWITRTVSYPTQEMVLSVFLPLELKATPRGPFVSRGQSSANPQLSQEIAKDGNYESVLTDRDGCSGYEMRLSLKNPRLRLNYRLAWDLPPQEGTSHPRP